MNHPWTVNVIYDGIGRYGAEVSSNDKAGIYAKVPFVHADEIDPSSEEILVAGSSLARQAAIEWIARWEHSEAQTPEPVTVDSSAPTQQEIDDAIASLDTSSGASSLGG